MYTILGAGLSGSSIADHLQKKQVPFTLFEAKSHGGGHIHSEVVDGFTWDEGPHVSFTKHQYVKEYFEQNLDNDFLEYPTKPTNYFHGNWIAHPAQSHMYAVPEPLRTSCVNDLIATRKQDSPVAENYQQWIDYAFGPEFASHFAKVYTEKYWTTGPEDLTTDWIGKRIYFPDVDDMVESAKGPLDKSTHYISKVRYPRTGGYYSYIKKVEERLPISYNKRLKSISFKDKQITFDNGDVTNYQQLISTLPLPMLILNSDAPEEIKQAAKKLKCSKVLLINVVARHPAPIDNHWLYVYDKEMYSTRINFTELLSPDNGVEGRTGIQVEVYFSDHRPLTGDVKDIAMQVIKELITMGLVESADQVASYHTKWLEWANVIFDTQRAEAQETVLNWLGTVGLQREADDMEPMTEWDDKQDQPLGDLILAGRFAQWKYYWTDDCVMRAKFIADNIKITTDQSIHA